MSAHSKFSPSASNTWLRCPASIRLSDGIEDTAGADAIRGTEIHATAEAILCGNPVPHPEHTDEAQPYVDYVRGLTGPGDKLLVEQVLPLAPYAPDGWGTADAVILSDGVAHVVDLKTGRNPVKPDSWQLVCYAVGVITKYWVEHDFNVVETHIFQGGKGVSHKFKVAELLELADQIATAAKAAMDPETKPVPGDAQCKWCRARSQCTARAIHVLQQAGEKFGLADLGAVLPVAQTLAKWSADVEERALQALVHGAQVPGFKLVESTSRRKWRDDAMQTIEDAGLGDKLIKRTLIPITQAQLILGKREAAPILDAATERPAGSPVMAPRDDPRPEIGPSIVSILNSK